jgi:serine/threonine protein kinase
LGIVAYAMLAGTPPFDGESISDLLLAHTGETPETVGTLRPDCPPDLSAAVHRMLEKDPRARWPSMRDVMSTLGSAPPPDDPAWAQAASLATGQSVAVDPEGKTWETPLPRPASRSLVTALDLTPGDTASVQAVVLDAAGDTLASNVQWTTADGAVASVTDDGRVVAPRTRRSNREDGRGVRR